MGFNQNSTFGFGNKGGGGGGSITGAANGLRVLGGNVILGDNDVPLTENVNIKGWENHISYYEEYNEIDSFAADTGFDSYTEFWRYFSLAANGTSNHPYTYLGGYADISSGGANGAYSYEYGIQYKQDQLDSRYGAVKIFAGNSDNPAHGFQYGEMWVRNNQYGRLLDLGDPSNTHGRNLSFRYGFFADDTTEGLVDADGVMYYNSTTDKLRAREGGVWKNVIGSGGGAGSISAIYDPINEVGNDAAYKYSDYIKIQLPASEVVEVDLSICIYGASTDCTLFTKFLLNTIAAFEVNSNISLELQMFGSGAAIRSSIIGNNLIETETNWSGAAGYENAPQHILKITGSITNTSATDGELVFGFKANIGYGGSIYQINQGSGGSVMILGTYVP